VFLHTGIEAVPELESVVTRGKGEQALRDAEILDAPASRAHHFWGCSSVFATLGNFAMFALNTSNIVIGWLCCAI
jgi:hypothetical protein